MPRWPYPTAEVELPLENGEDPMLQPIRLMTLAVAVVIIAPAVFLSPLCGALSAGALALLAAVAVYGYAFRGRPERLVLTPEGFRVTRVRGLVRRARREVAYRWDAVSAARVEVFRPGPDGDGARGATLVVTVGGTVVGGEPVAGGEEALRLDTRLTGVDELLEVLGAMTPHLPYRWARTDGSYTGVTNQYEQVARGAAAGD